MAKDLVVGGVVVVKGSEPDRSLAVEAVKNAAARLRCAMLDVFPHCDVRQRAYGEIASDRLSEFERSFDVPTERSTT